MLHLSRLRELERQKVDLEKFQNPVTLFFCTGPYRSANATKRSGILGSITERDRRLKPGGLG